MATREGWPVWYELMTGDPAGIADFYREAAGFTWATEGMIMPNGANYRQIERPGGGHVGGLLAFDKGMIDAGMRSMWATYFYTADVDVSIEKATGMGATVHMPATSIPGAGRMAMLSDPQGAMFYLIKPEPPADNPDAQSDVFDGGIIGRCAWNELNTDGAEDQIAFYTSLFDWEIGGEMPMPGDNIYKFLNCDGKGIGAIGSMKPDGMPSLWLPYFRVADIATAAGAIEANGGKILMGPHEVPGGDMIVVALDPAGAAVGFVGRKG